MMIYPVGRRFALVEGTRKPRNFSEKEYCRCRILGDYPTREAARVGARRIQRNRSTIKEKYQ